MLHWIYFTGECSLCIFLAILNINTFKYWQGSGGCLQLILSAGNIVCCPPLDLLQVLCIPQVQISLYLLTHSVNINQGNQNLPVITFYSYIVIKSPAICVKISLRLCTIPSVQFESLPGIPVWTEKVEWKGKENTNRNSLAKQSLFCFVKLYLIKMSFMTWRSDDFLYQFSIAKYT